MTSPRQRKKGLAYLRAKQLEQQQNSLVVEKQVVQEPLAIPAPTVVESAVKLKKTKNALVETKSDLSTLEQTKEEVKSETKE